MGLGDGAGLPGQDLDRWELPDRLSWSVAPLLAAPGSLVWSLGEGEGFWLGLVFEWFLGVGEWHPNMGCFLCLFADALPEAPWCAGGADELLEGSG